MRKKVQKKIFVLDGGSDEGSLIAALAESYKKGATEKGFEVVFSKVRDLSFDPILHKGYKEIQELEKDLVEQQKNLQWCDHFVLVTSVWWMSFPAKLKGFFDRALLPGFAFKYEEGALLPKGHMKGKSARVIYTQGAPLWMTGSFLLDGFYRNVKHGVLGFCGFGLIKRTAFGKADKADEETRENWKRKVYELGRKGE
ncbi:MAG: NAD(P)H-dependent oxidoreductase [Candidatus Moranbacteria bacterium]|nr:NAD(P)H-dependent oxidoreductase [Candidatus Moranbacteria bacterium]